MCSRLRTAAGGVVAVLVVVIVAAGAHLVLDLVEKTHDDGLIGW